jgi:hypothetical protein
MDSREAIVIKNLALGGLVTKIVYGAFAIAALVFVAMLMLTGLH